METLSYPEPSLNLQTASPVFGRKESPAFSAALPTSSRMPTLGSICKGLGLRAQDLGRWP